MKSIYKYGRTTILTVLLLVAAIFIIDQVRDAYAAATAGTATKRTYYRASQPPLDVITCIVTMSSIGTTAALSQTITGHIVGVKTDPGTTAPTDNYDLTINTDGGDLMGAALENRDTANTEWTVPAKEVFLQGESVTVTAAGNSVNNATVELTIYVEKH